MSASTQNEWPDDGMPEDVWRSSRHDHLAFAPINLKLALANPIADPIKMHINGF